MRIGVDVDGVLADFNASFIRRVIAYTGRDLFGAGYVPTTWNYPESVGYTKAEVDGVWATIKADRVFWLSLGAYYTVSMDLGALSDRITHHRDDVYFITARPGDDAKYQTEQWISARWPYLTRPTPTVIISSHKGLCAQALGLDCYIDDRWENCLETSSMHWKAEKPRCRTFIMHRPWNYDVLGRHEPIYRVSSVRDMLDIVVAENVATRRRNDSGVSVTASR